MRVREDSRVYSLHLKCSAEDVDWLSAELWECGTEGIRELDAGSDTVLIAGFPDNAQRSVLLERFNRFDPDWEQEDATDWVLHTQEAWPPRAVGERIFLAPPWCQEPTPKGRVRVVHNPGLACGTGEHPCTQLALEALERCVTPGATVADVGTGSGMLAIAALQLGAECALGTDVDEAALSAAQENFALNDRVARLVAGSAECLRTACADVVVANINGSVLAGMVDELVRVAKLAGCLILTGFPEWELAFFEKHFPECAVTAINEWRCVSVKIFS